MAELKFIGTEALIARGLEAMVQAVDQAAEDLVGKAQPAAPVVTGTLEGSIHNEGAKPSGMGVEARVSTGGESSAYAAIVHEGHRADGSYPRKAGPSKFLERPLLENSATYVEHIAAAGRAAY